MNVPTIVSAGGNQYTDAIQKDLNLSFEQAEALKKGPVVLYFFPKAFTTGCTAEAHDFAEATPKFNQLGATVIGMSSDDIATLHGTNSVGSTLAAMSADE